MPEIREFERHYGQSRTWVALFRRIRGYIDTMLLRDASNALRDVTIDRWQSRDVYLSFRERFAAEYAEFYGECEELTSREQSLGEFLEHT